MRLKTESETEELILRKKPTVLQSTYIHSKRRKLGMFILFQKCQFVYPNKVNSPPIRRFLSFSIFGQTCHVTIIKL